MTKVGSRVLNLIDKGVDGIRGVSASVCHGFVQPALWEEPRYKLMFQLNHVQKYGRLRQLI